MEAQIARLVDKTWAKLEALPPSQRLMIGVVGIPGSGKSTLAATLAARINERWRAAQQACPSTSTSPSTSVAESVSMDGFHLYRHELAAMPDPELAAARRGAAFTFNAHKFLALLRRLRQPLPAVGADDAVIYAPSFDHAKKDPVENDVAIPASARVLFIEGNYIALDREPWRACAALMDEIWFVEVDFETARQRLVARHLRAGLADTWEKADRRARENDLLNGEDIVRHLMPVQETIRSVEDDAWGKPVREVREAVAHN
ncbi:hypothetical protein KEM52_006322 [Ascosphaera acerosa]|nr:hypothetical protein KEM52_006322 [Ascosphaera acerosa]